VAKGQGQVIEILHIFFLQYCMAILFIFQEDQSTVWPHSPLWHKSLILNYVLC